MSEIIDCFNEQIKNCHEIFLVFMLLTLTNYFSTSSNERERERENSTYVNIKTKYSDMPKFNLGGRLNHLQGDVISLQKATKRYFIKCEKIKNDKIIFKNFLHYIHRRYFEIFFFKVLKFTKTYSKDLILL